MSEKLDGGFPIPPQNPYAAPPPAPAPVQPVSISREELKSVATLQRYMLLAILAQVVAYFVLMLGGALVSAETLSLFVLIARVGLVVLGLAGGVLGILLAMRMYGTVTGVILGLLTFVPCLGLIMLLVINQRATGMLQLHNISVGLLGADPDSI